MDPSSLRSLVLAVAACLLAACELAHAPLPRSDAAVDVTIDAPPACTPTQTACGPVCADLQTDRAHCGACGAACASDLVCVAGACRPSCGAGQVLCGGQCVTLATDRAHCGACGVRCPAGQVCAAGACGTECGASLATCGGAGDGGAGERFCADTQTDRRNCGACGAACGAGQRCEGGRCVTTCDPALTNCSGVCRDLQTDRAHCGACGAACPAGQVCAAGACALSCQAGLTDCAGTCRDVQTDRANCGACGAACPAGQVCSAGACAPSCAAGLTNCGGSCRDPQSDRANCGGCGRACDAGEVCNAGRCELSCMTGLANCAGSCRDLQTDRANCGTCGNACPAGQVCGAGRCGATCGVGTTDCAGTCRDLQTDRTNCGACGRACAAAEVCVAGACQLFCGPGLTNCGGSCRDVQADRAHCGACGVACAGTEVCNAGACETFCAAGLTLCGGACRRLDSDPAHCGSCGNACPAGQVCSMGACRVTCGAGLLNCGGACRDVQTDRAHCGACGAACAPDQVCNAGACQRFCAGGTTECAGGCRDVQTDRAHCGACGAACAGAEVCVGGACVLSCAAGQTACAGACRDLAVDPLNCGACGAACPADRACVMGTCRLVCPASQTLCGGACASLQTDPANCGACNNACAIAPNGVPACAAGACGVACFPGFANCDAMVPNGCEVNTQTSAAHCGACNNACTGGDGCVFGACRACALAVVRELAFPTDTAAGTLAGASRVAATTCRAGVSGPEDVYLLRVPTRAALRINTEGGALDTVVSVRRACGDVNTEVACNDDGGEGTRSMIRRVFEPGDYFVTVDTPTSAGGAYTLQVAPYAFAPNGQCSTATALSTGSPSATAQTTAGGGEQSLTCGAANDGGQVFYAVAIPWGQRATITVTPTGAPAWSPVVRVYDACGGNNCVASNAVGAAGAPVALNVDNNNGFANGVRTVVVSVATTSVATDATFDVAVAYAPMATPPVQMYAGSTIAGACDDMTGATVVHATSSFTDDSVSSIRALPFPLTFFGQGVTGYSATSNGFAQLYLTTTGTTSTAFTNTAIPNASTPNGFVAPFWDDLFPAPAGEAGSQIVASAFGMAPDRRFTIQWTNVMLATGVSPQDPTARLTFQAKLYETSNVVEFHYCSVTSSASPLVGSGSGGSATIGIESLDGARGVQASRDTARAVSTGAGLRFTPLP